MTGAPFFVEVIDSEKKKDTARDWLQAIFIWAFLLFWVFGFVSSLYAGGCYKDRYPAEKRLQICQNALGISGFLATRNQKSSNYLYQGIALSELGRNAAAIDTFRTAILTRNPGAKHRSSDEVFYILREHLRTLKHPGVPPTASENYLKALKAVRG